MQIQAVIDRVEGDVAVLEVAGTTVDWPVAALPPNSTEGTVLQLVLSVVPGDSSKANARLARMRRRGPSGDDIDL